MKIALKGRLLKVERVDSGITLLYMNVSGKVDGEGPTGRNASGDMSLTVSDRYVDQLRIGESFNIVVSTE